ncbi:MAG: CPBP family intramembrane metalloprotease [Gemmataceae bacterium]|nr:CPBP family intramembrane metalloprotease [Gemmataceae bacterium]
MPLAVVLLAVALSLTARLIGAFRPLAGYLDVMALLAVLLAVMPVLFASAAWSGLVPASTHEVTSLLAQRLVLAVAGLGVVAFVLLTGTRARDAYILPGTVVGRSGLRAPMLRQPVRWSILGPLGLIFLVGITAAVAVGSVPAVVDLEAALPYFGLAIVAALLNSFFEEAAYRSAPMSRLVPAVGPAMAVWLVAVWFGLGHFYGGSPSGARGAVASAGVGLMLGKAMIATRGIAWPWAWHFAVDLVIFSVIVLVSTAPGAGA